MKKLVKVSALVIVLCISTVSHAGGLTEKTVFDLMQKVDNATSSLNIAPIAEILSDNVAITMIVTTQGQTEVLKPTKQEYLSMLQDSWSMYTNYKYVRTNVKIKLESENRAQVTADVEESMTVQGQNITGQSKEDVTVELVAGKPKITRVTARVRM
jgi:hypothetical protein